VALRPSHDSGSRAPALPLSAPPGRPAAAQVAALYESEAALSSNPVK